MSISLAGARAAASRRNGAKSCGPKTPEGKARSALNALKHGLRAEKFVVVRGENPQAFAALETSLAAELAPEGVLQGLLAGRIARAAWRLERAERIEAELFARLAYDNANLGLAMIRDGNGSRSIDTLLRYRGTALAELWRALRLLKALQAEPAQQEAAGRVALPQPQTCDGAALETPIEPEDRRNPDEIALLAADQAEAETRPARRDTDAGAVSGAAQGGIDRGQGSRPPTPCENPKEPESRKIPGESSLAAGAGGLEDFSAGPVADHDPPDAGGRPEPHDHQPVSRETPKEPEAHQNPRERVLAPTPLAPPSGQPHRAVA
jgi:hypothetical protein